MNEIICMKKNGKVKLVKNQFDLNALNRDEYLVYYYPVGVYSSVFKPINPKSGWTKPIKKAHVIYALNSYISGSYDLEPYEEAVFGDGILQEATFNNAIDFVAFVASLEKLSMVNVLQNEGFGHAQFLAAFRVEITDIDGNVRNFNMSRKMAKSHGDIFYKMGFGVATMIIELMDFMDDLNKFCFTKPYPTNRDYIFVDSSFKHWQVGPMKTADRAEYVVSVPMVLTGLCTFVRSDILYVLSFNHYQGNLRLLSYSLEESEDTLPFDFPYTAEIIEDYTAAYFEVYDEYMYPLITAADFIECATMLPYVITTMRMIHEMRGDSDYWKGMRFMTQISLFPSSLTPAREVDPPPMKYMVYEDEIPSLDIDQSLSDFVKTLLLWIEHPVSVDGRDDYLDANPF